MASVKQRYVALQRNLIVEDKKRVRAEKMKHYKALAAQLAPQKARKVPSATAAQSSEASDTATKEKGDKATTAGDRAGEGGKEIAPVSSVAEKKSGILCSIILKKLKEEQKREN